MLETDTPKDAPQGISATVLQTDLNVEKKRDKTEGGNTQQDYESRYMLDSMDFPGNGMETSACKQEEQETQLVEQKLRFASQRLVENGRYLYHIYSLSGYIWMNHFCIFQS